MSLMVTVNEWTLKDAKLSYKYYLDHTWTLCEKILPNMTHISITIEFSGECHYIAPLGKLYKISLFAPTQTSENQWTNVMVWDSYMVEAHNSNHKNIWQFKHISSFDIRDYITLDTRKILELQ